MNDKLLPFPSRIILTFSILFISFSLSAQENKKSEVYTFARRVVDTMASPGMHGRGYVNGGDSLAAEFIKSVFQRAGVKAFNNRYYQKLSFPVNVFDDISLYADGRMLSPGKDYIPSDQNPSGSGKFAVAYADDALVQSKKQFKKFKKLDLSDKILVVNDTGKPSPELQSLAGAKATVYLKDKLTWGVGQKQQEKPSFDVLRTSVTTPHEISYAVKSHVINHAAQNVLGYIPGYDYPDSFIVFTAHYDHLGQLGKDVYFPGANDNASGCAMLLSLAKYYARPEHRPRYTVVFIAFCGEEAGLLGSRYFTQNPVFPLKNIRFLLNMDIMGTGEDGITVVNGSIFKNEFDALKKINDENGFLKEVKIRGKAANSDHYLFSEKGVHACFIYTMGGIKAYHDIYDKAETLPLNEFDDLFKLIVRFGDYLQGK
jgi:hypothetical protein